MVCDAPFAVVRLRLTPDCRIKARVGKLASAPGALAHRRICGRSNSSATSGYCCISESPSLSKRGMPKCPRRCSRSTGLRLPGHRHQSQALGRLRQHHRAAHVDAIQHHPDVGGFVVNRPRRSARGLPDASSRADGRPARIESTALRRECPRRPKAQHVHAHAVQFRRWSA